jgi:hypothetical protein
MGRDICRQGGLLRRRQFARPMTAPRAGAHLPGPPPPDHSLVDVRHADPKNRRRRPRRHATVNRSQNPRPQVLRIALPPPPHHRCPHILRCGSESHLLWFRKPFPRFQPMRLCSSKLNPARSPALAHTDREAWALCGRSGKHLVRTLRDPHLDLLRKSGEFPVSNEELDDTATTVYEGI